MKLTKKWLIDYLETEWFYDFSVFFQSNFTAGLPRDIWSIVEWLLISWVYSVTWLILHKKSINISQTEQSFQNLDNEDKDFKSKLLEIQNDFKIKEMKYLWNENELINEKKELEKKVKNLEKEIAIVQKRADDLLLNKENSSEVEMTESEFTKKMKKQQKKYDDAIEELNKYYLKVAEHEKTIHNLKQKLEEAQKEIDRLDSDTRCEDLKNEIALRKSRYESSEENNTELKQDINRIKLAGEYFRPWEEPKISKK